MTFVITGPHPSNTTQIVLPSPQLSNTAGLTGTVDTIRFEDGSLNTYVKRKRGRKRYRWEFLVGHLKAKEIEDYCLTYAGKLHTCNWRGVNYFGWLTLNPIDFRGRQSESFTVVIELEEKK